VFTPGRSAIIIRRKPTAQRPNPRPILRIEKLPKKRAGPKPPLRALPRKRPIGSPELGPTIEDPGLLERRFQVPTAEFLTGKPAVILTEAAAAIRRARRTGTPTAPPRPPKTETPVSIHKSILKSLGQAAIARAGRPKVAPAAGFLAGAVSRSLPAIGRVATAAGIGASVGGLFGGGGGGGGACEVGHHLNKQDGVGGPAGTYCVKNRRMNVGNARAARRAVRRLKGARKLLRDIEKMMPTRSTRRRAPQHHHHPAAGGN